MEKPAVAPSSTGQPWSLKMLAPLEPGIVCTDMERMLKFYTEIVGLKLVGDAETTPEMSTKFRATPHGYRIVRMQTPYGERIKLAQPKVPPAKNPIPEWVFQRGNNVKLVSEEPVEVRKGVFAIFALDPEGNYVEFVEFPDIASYRPDLFKK